MEFKTIKIADVSVSERKIIGYASTFGNVDETREIVEIGAFKKTLKEREPKFFYNHTWPIGRPKSIFEDERGLFAESRVSKTARGDEILELTSDGVLSHMSIGYKRVKWIDEQKTGIRRLKELALFEYGPVDFPANNQAAITGVKALADRITGNHKIDPEGLAHLRRELKSLLDVIDRGTGEPDRSTPHDAEPSIDTRVMQLPEEWSGRLAEAFRL